MGKRFQRQMAERARDLGVTQYIARPFTPVGLYPGLLEAYAHPGTCMSTALLCGLDRSSGQSMPTVRLDSQP